MKIQVKAKGRQDVNITLPTALAMNGAVARFLPGVLKAKGVRMSAKQSAALFRAVRAYQKEHPEWILVEVESRSGEQVTIRL